MDINKLLKNKKISELPALLGGISMESTIPVDDASILDPVSGKPISRRITLNKLKEIIGSSSSVKTSNVIKVEPSLASDVEGIAYSTYLEALNYIITQSPSESNSWVIELPAGDFEENIEFHRFINIKGFNTRLTGVLTSTYYLDADLSDIINNVTYIKDCIILNMYSVAISLDPPEGIGMFPFFNCILDLDSGTSSTLAFAFIQAFNCQIKSGDFSNSLVQVISGMLSGGSYADKFGDMSLLTVNGALVTLLNSSLSGGTFHNCEISNMDYEYNTFSSGDYKFFNCNISNIEIGLEITKKIKAVNCHFDSCIINLYDNSEAEFIQTHLDEECIINLNGANTNLITKGCTGLINFMGDDIVGGNIEKWSNILDYGAASNLTVNRVAYVSELLPIEIFDDGSIPPDTLIIIGDTIRVREFSITNSAIISYPKPQDYPTTSPIYVNLKFLVTDINGINIGDIIKFNFKFKKIGGAYITTIINWQATESYSQFDTITTPYIQVLFAPEATIFDLNIIEIERINSNLPSEYAYKIGVLYLELRWSKI